MHLRSSLAGTCLGLVLLSGVSAVAAADASSAARAADAGKPPGPVRHAPSGHVSNYDEAKIGTYTLPDPLVSNDGQPVRDAATWWNKRRPELLQAYKTQIYGRVPSTAPKAHAEVVATGDPVADGAGVRTHVIVHFGSEANGPKADVVIYRPTRIEKAPVLLQLVFFRGLASELPEPPVPAASGKAKRGPEFPETGPVAEILHRGYAYATFRYTDVQPDNATTYEHGVEALARRPGQTKRAPDEWGAISAWAWAASRVLDYIATDSHLDASRVAVIGHSRLGKTALWAGAMDPRFALVFSSCSGKMGAALARRDYGETIDDMAANFPYQFAGNFQKYIGHWNQMPVDAHCLIALSAPRPVFITGGTEDQWADPRGEFLAEVAAGPVYRLLGKKELGTAEMPAPDTALLDGNLGWRYHTGPHAIVPQDWEAFLDFADRHLK